MDHQIIDIFPTPLRRAKGSLPLSLVAGLIAHFSVQTDREYMSSLNLSHTRMLNSRESPLFGEAAKPITPKLIAMGEQMFGEVPDWSIKEMWVNFRDAWGGQAMPNHTNSFTSGMAYLTAPDPDSPTSWGYVVSFNG